MLGAGLKRVYRNGRDAFAVAQDDPSQEHLHEWRKQVKYLWHQLQVLQPIQLGQLTALADQAHAWRMPLATIMTSLAVAQVPGRTRQIP